MKMLRKIMASMLCITMLVSCGGGGGGSESAPVSLRLENPSTEFAQQQVVSAKVANHQLTSNTYQAIIDGTTPIILTKSSVDSLAWIMPTLSDGQHTLQAEFGGQKVTLSFSTKQVAVIGSAEEIVNNLLPDLTAAIDSEIVTLTGQAGQDAMIAQLQKIKTDLSTLPAQISTLSIEQKQVLASLVDRNFISGRQSLKSIAKTTGLSKTPACLDSESVLKLSSKIIGIDILVAASSLVLGPVAPVAFTLGMGMFIVDTKYFVKAVKLYWTNCKPNPLDRLLDGTSKQAATLAKSVDAAGSQVIAFNHNTARSFIIKTDYSITDSSVLGEFAKINNVIASIPESILPKCFLDWVSSNIATTKNETSPASTYSIQSISDSNITYASDDLNGRLQLKFSFIQQTLTSSVPFTFTLVDSRDNHTTTVSATLTPATIDHIIISPANPSIRVKGALQLTATAYDINGQTVPAVATDYRWASNDPLTAQVDDNGLITGVAVGQAEISVVNKLNTNMKYNVTVSVINYDVIQWNGNFSQPTTPNLSTNQSFAIVNNSGVVTGKFIYATCDVFGNQVDNNIDISILCEGGKTGHANFIVDLNSISVTGPVELFYILTREYGTLGYVGFGKIIGGSFKWDSDNSPWVIF